MNVSVAAQTLSASVATAIDFHSDLMNHPDFDGSKATANGYKAPVTQDSLTTWITIFEELTSYLFYLKDAFSIESGLSVAKELLTHTYSPHQFILIYKF